MIETLEQVATDAGTTAAAAALAWVRSRPGVASTLIGVRTTAQLDANLASLEVELSPEQVQTLTAASEPQLNFRRRTMRS